MLQMMFDTSRITHTTCWNDHLWLRIKINRFGIITCNRNLQTRKTDRINSLSNQFHCFFIKAVILMLGENSSRLICQRTVYIYLEIVMSVYQIICLDLSDKIQHFLCTAYCKRRHYQISSSVKGFLDNFCKELYIVRFFPMAAVTVGWFHNYIICMMQIFRILDQRLTGISNIARKYNGFFNPIFPEYQFYTRRAKKMSGINKTYGNSISRSDHFIIRTSHKISDHTHCIFHCICRYKFRFALTSSLTVSPFCFKHLNMCTVS